MVKVMTILCQDESNDFFIHDYDVRYFSGISPEIKDIGISVSELMEFFWLDAEFKVIANTFIHMRMVNCNILHYIYLTKKNIEKLKKNVILFFWIHKVHLNS